MSLARAQELVSQAEYGQAEAVLLRHLRSSPGDADALHLMGYVLAHTGQTEKALYYAQRAADASPGASTLVNLGTTLLALQRETEGLEALRRAVEMEGGTGGAGAAHALALGLNSMQRYTESRDLCLDVLHRYPKSVPVSLDLADALQNLAMADEAVEILERVAAAHPDDPLVAGNLAAATNYAAGPSPQMVLEAHRRFATALSRNLPRPAASRIVNPDPERAIRLGLIIPDLTRHSVAYFIRPVLERLDPAKFTVFIYYTGVPESGRGKCGDGRGLAPAWPMVAHTARFVAWDPLPRLDEIVRGDRLDMLMDLCGMSTRHRLQLMHIKPAPIQLTYAGYPNTTGLSAIDYRVVDSYTDPAGSEGLATEELVRLNPCFLCYTPPGDAPRAVNSQGGTGAVTFGSFNHLPKLNDPLIGLWARVLREAPGSRLMLKAQGLLRPEVRAEIAGRFASAGVSGDRLSLLPPTATRSEHLALYADIDIALDSFPYHGTTTTCEALFMGVPVVTLAGKTHVSRVGVSLLNNVGLSELVADSESEYVRIASGLSSDSARRHSLSSGLRERMAASAVCDRQGFADRFAAMLRGIWMVRCRQHDGQGQNPA